jgi:hypothetical protein
MLRPAWPIDGGATRCWLQACCCVAEGATVVRHPSASCVAAVLGDLPGRMTVFPGREGLPRSLGSVLSSVVARFVGSRLRPVKLWQVDCLGLCALEDMPLLAIGSDDRTLLHANSTTSIITQLCLATGSRLRAVGSPGSGPLMFNYIVHLCIAPDGMIYVVERTNQRVQVLTPELAFAGFVERQVPPRGAAVDNAMLAIADITTIDLYDRHSMALLHSIDGYPHIGMLLALRQGGVCAPVGENYLVVEVRADNGCCFAHVVALKYVWHGVSASALVDGGVAETHAFTAAPYIEMSTTTGDVLYAIHMDASITASARGTAVMVDGSGGVWALM